MIADPPLVGNPWILVVALVLLFAALDWIDNNITHRRR